MHIIKCKQQAAFSTNNQGLGRWPHDITTVNSQPMIDWDWLISVAVDTFSQQCLNMQCSIYTPSREMSIKTRVQFVNISGAGIRFWCSRLSQLRFRINDPGCNFWRHFTARIAIHPVGIKLRRQSNCDPNSSHFSVVIVTSPTFWILHAAINGIKCYKQFLSDSHIVY